jgi:hypothetical protein
MKQRSRPMRIQNSPKFRKKALKIKRMHSNSPNRLEGDLDCWFSTSRKEQEERIEHKGSGPSNLGRIN